MSMLEFKQLFEGYDELHATLDAIPDRLMNNVFRRAGRQAGKAVAQRAAQSTPREGRVPQDGLGHLADRFRFVQRIYRSENKTVFVVGSESGPKNRINHLVEFGTRQRFTQHRSQYRTVDAGHVMRSRKVKTANGWRTVKERISRRKKQSIGSFRRGDSPKNRGIMPAFHQLEKAWNQTPVQTIVTQEIIAGLAKIADKDASANP